MRAWIFQDHRQKQKLGEKAPWSVGWINPDGKRRSKRIGSKSMAEKFRRKTEGELAAGTYQDAQRKTWADFRVEFEANVASQMKPSTRRLTIDVIKNFERLIKPVKLDAIKPQTIQEYITKRQKDAVKKRGRQLAPASINKELRHLKAVLRIAEEWGFMTAPKIRMLKEPKRLKSYVTPEDFAKLYAACDKASRPTDVANVTAPDWWRGLLTFAYMTGGFARFLPCAGRMSTWRQVRLSRGPKTTRPGGMKPSHFTKS